MTMARAWEKAAPRRRLADRLPRLRRFRTRGGSRRFRRWAKPRSRCPRDQLRSPGRSPPAPRRPDSSGSRPEAPLPGPLALQSRCLRGQICPKELNPSSVSSSLGTGSVGPGDGLSVGGAPVAAGLEAAWGGFPERWPERCFLCHRRSSPRRKGSRPLSRPQRPGRRAGAGRGAVRLRLHALRWPRRTGDRSLRHRGCWPRTADRTWLARDPARV